MSAKSPAYDYPEDATWAALLDSRKLSDLAEWIAFETKRDLASTDRTLVPGFRSALRKIADMEGVDLI